jgi:hypothetical protein
MRKTAEKKGILPLERNKEQTGTASFQRRIRAIYHASGIEFFFWAGALIALAVAPTTSEPHFTLCPFALAGLAHCPGCGLGRSLSFLLHGDIARSIEMHCLGIPALGVIAVRCFRLLARTPRLPSNSSPSFNTSGKRS